MKIFLASPSDAANYRQAANRVADRLNEENGVKLGSELFLEVVDWNSHIAPLMSLPESAVLQEVEVGEHDVFLGLAWLGFDGLAAAGSAETGDAGSIATGRATSRCNACSIAACVCPRS